MSKRTLLLADDHKIFLQGLTQLIAECDDFEVLATVTDGEQAWNEIQRLKPDIAILDLNLPKYHGLEILRRSQEHKLETLMVILTQRKDPSVSGECWNCGARACLVKEDAFEDLATALRTVGPDTFFLSRSLKDLEGSIKVRLTPRELEVLHRIAAGYSNKEVAHELGIGVKTVETHRLRVMQKLEAHNAADLTRHALRLGLLSS